MGWFELSETQQTLVNVGFRSSTQPTFYIKSRTQINAAEKGILINLLILYGSCIKLVLIIDMIDDARNGLPLLNPYA